MSARSSTRGIKRDEVAMSRFSFSNLHGPTLPSMFGVAIKKVLGFVTLRSQPNTQARREIRIDKKLHLVSGISRWAT